MGFRMTGSQNNSLYDRVNKLLVSYEWSDCCFIVGDKKFKAHKLILGMTSPVFEAMFYGPLSSNDAITITDIEPNIFQMLLTYIYTDKVEIKSIDEAYDLMYVSRKYMLEYLTEVCAAYLIKNTNIDNVISILNYPDHMQDKEVVTHALKLFCQHAEYLFQEQKQHISLTCMQKIVKSCEMNLCERDLIKYVFDWTICYCDQNDIKNNKVNRREVLDKNGIYKYLRFSNLSPNDMRAIIDHKENVLKNCEITNIRELNNANLPLNEEVFGSLEYRFMPRKPIKISWDICQRTPIRSEAPVIIEHLHTTVETRIKVDESTFIRSLSVPSRMTPVIDYFNISKMYNEQFAVSIKCEEDNSIVKEMQFKKSVEYDSIVDIVFEKPFLLKKTHWYKITFTWPHTNYHPHYYAVQKREKCYLSSNNKFFFDDIFYHKHDGGSFLRGLKYSV